MIAASERGYFHWIDWLVFALMLFVSAIAGLWHFRSAQKSDTRDYLLGGRSLGLFPVTASLVASFISGVTILGTPTEIYNFGTQYWITIISIFFSGIVVAFVYLPVFTTLQLNSVYEGGIRAVVWTDALQVGVMIAAAISVTALGTYQMGGMSEIWNKAVIAKRIEFLNFDPSPYTRHTVWTVLIGSWLYCTAYIAVNQTMVQRYKSLETRKKSQLSIAIFTISVMVFISICCWCGLVLLAWWSPPKCDPRVSRLITADDQLLPAYVMEIAGDLHGIPGLFISGVFGAALSEDNVFPLYRLSYHWVAPIGTLVVLVIGGLVTWITGAMDPSSIDKNLLSPVIHRYNRLIWQLFVTTERNITFDLQMVTSTEISK
ncbi:hypothetical protein ACFW04_009043 [Cataglyphis niger]